jgi:MoxR-like ATPase
LGILLRMQRVSVVGNSGSGKTTIAAELARLIGPGCPWLRFIRLTTPGEVQEFLAAVGQPQAGGPG